MIKKIFLIVIFLVLIVFLKIVCDLFELEEV